MTEFRNITRVAEVYKSGEWVKTPFQDVKKYDVFKLYEPDGSPVTDTFTNDDGIITTATSVALCDAFMSDDDVLTIRCAPIPESKS